MLTSIGSSSSGTIVPFGVRAPGSRWRLFLIVRGIILLHGALTCGPAPRWWRVRQATPAFLADDLVWAGGHPAPASTAVEPASVANDRIHSAAALVWPAGSDDRCDAELRPIAFEELAPRRVRDPAHNSALPPVLDLLAGLGQRRQLPVRDQCLVRLHVGRDGLDPVLRLADSALQHVLERVPGLLVLPFPDDDLLHREAPRPVVARLRVVFDLALELDDLAALQCLQVAPGSVQRRADGPLQERLGALGGEFVREVADAEAVAHDVADARALVAVVHHLLRRVELDVAEASRAGAGALAGADVHGARVVLLHPEDLGEIRLEARVLQEPGGELVEGHHAVAAELLNTVRFAVRGGDDELRLQARPDDLPLPAREGVDDSRPSLRVEGCPGVLAGAEEVLRVDGRRRVHAHICSIHHLGCQPHLLGQRKCSNYRGLGGYSSTMLPVESRSVARWRALRTRCKRATASIRTSRASSEPFSKSSVRVNVFTRSAPRGSTARAPP